MSPTWSPLWMDLRCWRACAAKKGDAPRYGASPLADLSSLRAILDQLLLLSIIKSGRE